MNILYINHYAGSPYHGMEFRPYYLAKEWLNNGHKITILASSFSHVRSKQPNIKHKITEENIDGIHYIWYPTNKYKGNGILRVINIFSFLLQIILFNKKIIKKTKPNIILASSTYPLDIWVAKYLAKKHKAKLIFEIHDLWPLSPIELGGMSPKHPFMTLCQYAENSAYKYSDAVISILPKVHQHVIKHGLDINKLHIIPNGIVYSDWEDGNYDKIPDNIRSKINTLKNKGYTIVGYSGSHGIPNALRYLIEAADLLRDKPFHFILVGSGLEKNNLLEYKNSLDLENITFFEPITKKQMPDLLTLFDISYIGAHKTPIYRFGISPNKLMDYMMAENVILSSIEAGNDPVTDAACGITVEAESSKAIADALIKLSEYSLEEKQQMGKNGKNYVLKNHTYSVLADKFLQVMKKL
ncbi:putative glycosyltransferase [Xenorhabdus nematophila ATCC 19061]|uniref:Glycosyltransferase n=1 Tax=Xenorhabdus nematophila (strain ATCC 19061 / DSM 3370 / CCUG 14189 / LMG 1036 / NCIMB 9965 / AN6) TaxID=406817 RepID=D3VGD2_XENNA|nr:glycosyltransferase family 4 protein [Xenorhabdus nematophila]CBJ88222.1 putative glycosyltransferase [Xenorhabdus nematophila ATCC 19061]CEK21142.1 putative glycosyltransferase [Xenorhabdus nematophila AN6/1]